MRLRDEFTKKKISYLYSRFKLIKNIPKNETCIIETNLSRYNNIMTPKILTTSDIINKFSREWILQDVLNRKNRS